MSEIMVDQDDTQILVTRATGGDRAAFEELVVKFRGRLESSITARLNHFGLSNLDTEELTQEVIVRAFESLDRFEWRDEDSFYRWLSGIAKNVALKAAQKDRRIQSLEVVRDRSTGEAPPSRAVRREERFERLEAKIKDLSPEYREVVMLARIDGLPIKEIAQRMNRTPAAVKKLLSRALAKLRSSFGDTESLHLPDQRLDVDGDSHEAR